MERFQKRKYLKNVCSITLVCVHTESLQLCLTLLDYMDCSPLGASVHGILQARTLEWIAIYFSRGSSQPGDQTGVYCIVGRSLTTWATRKLPKNTLRLCLLNWILIHTSRSRLKFCLTAEAFFNCISHYSSFLPEAPRSIIALSCTPSWSLLPSPSASVINPLMAPES